MVRTTFDEPERGLPGPLQERLAAFPVAAVRDETDRLAAMAEELERVGTVLEGLGIDDHGEQLRLMDRYLKALYARLAEAGKWSPPQDRPLMAIITVTRPRGLPIPVFRLANTLGAWIGGPTRAWVSNRRVGWRRRKWRHLLA